MSNAQWRTPHPVNEPVLSYAPGTKERAGLQAKLKEMSATEIEIPLVIGGREVRTGRVGTAVKPHAHRHVLAKFHLGGAAEVEQAAKAAAAAWPAWSETPWEDRAAIFLKAAELLAGPWRHELNAATMLGQSKNAFQAEIDAACELIDFWRYNARFAEEIYAEQPLSAPGVWNRAEYRALEGFVLAITPFNFTSIAGNLPTAPALMGACVIWKPASTAVYSAWAIMRLLKEAGLPDGVINLVAGNGADVGAPALAHRDFAGLHFTGSTGVFNDMWRTMAENLPRYRGYPRIVGETGGKDFVFAHASADPVALAVALVRGAFEYQGQKCSAASRAYVPTSLWPKVRDLIGGMLSEIRIGPPEDFGNFVNAVIDRKSFENIRGYVEHARAAAGAKVVFGGDCDDREGWFVKPTVVETTEPKFKLLCEEIFGPVLTVFPYDDARLDEALKQCDEASPYALTGAVFAQDRYALRKMSDALRHAAGNFYLNDKPTGAVVGQQPFGGARASGTNDKAGSKLNLLRWVNARSIKENFVPPTTWRYPFLEK
ncbi:MAG TPA: L-glutamate gamma-semialdehyde dehydrogenase [Planctomycetota bacterium]|nr:L-glutamate gamma-semialdehyde dehydrogenase [Planctomycetota bacterium]